MEYQLATVCYTPGVLNNATEYSAVAVALHLVVQVEGNPTQVCR